MNAAGTALAPDDIHRSICLPANCGAETFRAVAMADGEVVLSQGMHTCMRLPPELAAWVSRQLANAAARPGLDLSECRGGFWVLYSAAAKGACLVIGQDCIHIPTIDDLRVVDRWLRSLIP